MVCVQPGDKDVSNMPINLFHQLEDVIVSKLCTIFFNFCCSISNWTCTISPCLASCRTNFSSALSSFAHFSNNPWSCRTGSSTYMDFMMVPFCILSSGTE
ncbi:hypothetical protein GDO86_015484 [Hymenochirus boettgeri]|uniref:Uncharacterized protein n=1 Tax=Hymenochirus boettgeri TaxID=247094 RepID=A0A8T2JT36_9PIPI|nr:hypothetical protein GDO86_015484 [Hymenochirus boettgeri]